jgi:hypothetical protein
LQVTNAITDLEKKKTELTKATFNLSQQKEKITNAVYPPTTEETTPSFE